jgi:hypothetical protein
MLERRRFQFERNVRLARVIRGQNRGKAGNQKDDHNDYQAPDRHPSPFEVAPEGFFLPFFKSPIG